MSEYKSGKGSFMKQSVKAIISAVVGILFVGIGVAFNNCAGLGNDSIGIVYDGVRNTANLTTEQLGTASNYINFGLAIILFFISRKYISVGTLIYILPYGFFVSLGTGLYNLLSLPETIIFRALVATVGSLLLYLGVAIFIATDIGVDPFTGIVMVIKDKTNKEYAPIKIMFDISMIIIGIILGGKFGIITLITALTAGPVIQFFTKKVRKLFKFEGR